MSREKQAIVVIHGIGEQQPMSTLRGFVASVSAGKKDEKVQFYSKPDELSDLYELRRLSVYARSKYVSDFFEYYWAHNLRGTKLSHLSTWALRLMWRRPGSIPKRIRWLHFFMWMLAIVYAVLLVLGVQEYLKHSEFFSLPVIGLLLGLIVHALTFLGTHYLGDAARYTYPAPDNIADRQRIRSDGVKLLKKIHESGKYDRIIVVGHSLGSVIAYDILKHLWSQYNTTHNYPMYIDQAKLDHYEKEFADDPRKWSPEKVEAFQNFQQELWTEQRSLGNPWLVSDFITLGSPLVYSSLLMASDEEELKDRITEREIPVCPPQTEGGKISYPVDYVVEGSGPREMTRTLMCLHHAAHFACTRWHNLYYQNDFVGGPLKNVLGVGIADAKVKSTSAFLNRVPFAAHTHYWGKAKGNNDALQDSIQRIHAILSK